MHDWEHLVSLFNTKFFHVDAKFTLVELGHTHHSVEEDFDNYVKRFHEKALDFCNLRCAS